MANLPTGMLSSPINSRDAVFMIGNFLYRMEALSSPCILGEQRKGAHVVVTIKQGWVLRNLPSIVILDVFSCKGFIDLGGLMFSSNRTETNLRKAKMFSLLWVLITTTKLADDVRIEIISMQILPTDVLAILIAIMQLLFTEMLPFLVSM